MAPRVASTDPASDTSAAGCIRARHCKNDASQDFFLRGNFQPIVHRYPWSTPATMRCSRPRSLTFAINRYYDPATNQFLSVDPLVGETGQPYVYSNDNPLNEADPLGAYACSAVTNGPKQCRTGVSITVVVWGATTATGTTVITATASVTVTNASPNASVTANLNWNGTVDVTVGHAGVTLVPGPPTVVSAGLVTTYTTTSTPMNVGSSSARVTDAVTTTVYTAPPNPPTTSPNWDLWGVLAFVGLLIVVAVFAPEAGGVILEPALT